MYQKQVKIFQLKIPMQMITIIEWKRKKKKEEKKHEQIKHLSWTK